ncbi:MAG: hypothetical protein WC264_00490 [Candidatus Paceibacterota bacterium]|jgi:hypothetical protein
MKTKIVVVLSTLTTISIISCVLSAIPWFSVGHLTDFSFYMFGIAVASIFSARLVLNAVSPN